MTSQTRPTGIIIDDTCHTRRIIRFTLAGNLTFDATTQDEGLFRPATIVYTMHDRPVPGWMFVPYYGKTRFADFDSEVLTLHNFPNPVPDYAAKNDAIAQTLNRQ